MTGDDRRGYTAFEGFERIGSGSPMEVGLASKAVLDRGERAPVLIFDDETGEQVELDLRGTLEEIRERLAPSSIEEGPEIDPEPRGPGRPKLGVVGREVTLLPRHWDWLNGQPGGASVALRKLVEEARRDHEGRDRVRRAREATYRVMSSLAGNLPGFEEASRALFAGDPERMAEQIRGWPEDVRSYLSRLAARSRGSDGKAEPSTAPAGSGP